MENNKPEWLLKAEQEQAKFNKTKWAKYTDGQIEQVIAGSLVDNRLDSELQSKYGKIGGSKGGNIAWNNLVNKVGLEEAKKISVNKLHSTMTHEDMLANTKKAAKVSGENRRKKSTELAFKILSHLPINEWLTFEQIKEACAKEGKAKTYFTDVKRITKMIETIGRGPNTKNRIKK